MEKVFRITEVMVERLCQNGIYDGGAVSERIETAGIL